VTEEDRREHSGTGHPSRDRLIDLVDGSLEGAEARALDQHLARCGECRAYVDSLKTTLDLARAAEIPEQPDAYWRGFEGEVRRRVRSRAARGKWGWLKDWAAGWKEKPALPGRRPRLGREATGRRWRLALVLSPAAAVALAVALVLTRPQVPSYVADLEPQLESMTVSEMASTVSEDAAFADVLIEAAGEDLSSIEEYILETEDLEYLIDGLADQEAEDLASAIADRMQQKGTKAVSKDDHRGLS